METRGAWVSAYGGGGKGETIILLDLPQNGSILVGPVSVRVERTATHSDNHFAAFPSMHKDV